MTMVQEHKLGQVCAVCSSASNAGRPRYPYKLAIMLRQHPCRPCKYRQQLAQEIVTMAKNGSPMKVTAHKLHVEYEKDFQLAAMAGICGLGRGG